MFSLHSARSSLLNWSSQRRTAARKEGRKGGMCMQKDGKQKAKCKFEKKQQPLDFSPCSFRFNAKRVFQDTLKYHQFRIYFSPLLEVLFCHQPCWTINLIQLPKDKTPAVDLFCVINEKVRLLETLFTVWWSTVKNTWSEGWEIGFNI